MVPAAAGAEPPPKQAQPAPSPTARLIESTPSAVITVEQAAAGFTTVLRARTPCGATDDDVVLDLTQVLQNALTPQHGPSARASGTRSLRQKLSDRLREGRLTPACLSELEARLDDLDTALRHD
ncbi:hypothetical protein ACFQQB_22025 [Nonomuraea rubra]|uniref:hypothetical protein n=1 Tax=Nonomuraea rubra TaxID=46180 RepID=UPI00360E6A34